MPPEPGIEHASAQSQAGGDRGWFWVLRPEEPGNRRGFPGWWHLQRVFACQWSFCRTCGPASQEVTSPNNFLNRLPYNYLNRVPYGKCTEIQRSRCFNWFGNGTSFPSSSEENGHKGQKLTRCQPYSLLICLFIMTFLGFLMSWSHPRSEPSLCLLELSLLLFGSISSISTDECWQLTNIIPLYLLNVPIIRAIYMSGLLAHLDSNTFHFLAVFVWWRKGDCD